MDSCWSYCQDSIFLMTFLLAQQYWWTSCSLFSDNLHNSCSLIVVLITLFNIEYDCSAYKAINFLRWTYSFCNINDTKILLLLFSLLFVDESVSIRFFEGCTIAAFCCCFSIVVSLGTCSASMSMKNKMPFKSQCINQSYLLSIFILIESKVYIFIFLFFRSEIKKNINILCLPSLTFLSEF